MKKKKEETVAGITPIFNHLTSEKILIVWQAYIGMMIREEGHDIMIIRLGRRWR